MATSSEKLAQSLEVLRKLQKGDGKLTIRTKHLSRTHKERLLGHGFITEVIKGWFILSRPDAVQGDSTDWYTSFWRFCADYLEERFSKDWCVSPEQSIALHSGNWIIPSQLLIRTPKGHNNQTTLLYGTSLFDAKLSIPTANNQSRIDGIRLYSLPKALIACPESYFRNHPTDICTSLALIGDASDILTPLLEGGHTIAAGRLAGAFRKIGNARIADSILETMKKAGYDAREKNPFQTDLSPYVFTHVKSPYIQRIRLMWQQMRETVLENFPEPTNIPSNKNDYMKQVEDVYSTDAYHSLSIEGYLVSLELIEKVRSGQWNPTTNSRDQEHKNAMVARGYWQAFQSVKRSIEKVLDNQNAGKVVDIDHGDWYRELFAPSVASGILKPRDLAGYRNSQVYIRQSKHVPMNRGAVRDCMPVLFELLAEETEPSVRAVLGHFTFVYIHPYMDGNGRIGRFLMNVMLASGGFPWAVIPIESRDIYMNALEQASVHQNIKLLSVFVGGLV